MRKSIILLTGCVILGGSNLFSQSPMDEYNKFRQQILNDYSNFKSRILEHYDDFLNGEWHEFEPLIEQESPYTSPKPKTLPVLEEKDVPSVQPMTKLPDPNFSPTSLPGTNAGRPSGKPLSISGNGPAGFGGNMKIDVPNMGESKINGEAMTPTTLAFIKKDLEGKSNYMKALMRLPDPEFAFGSFPGQTAVPKPGESGIIDIDMSKRIAEAREKSLAEGSGYATELTFQEPENSTSFRFDYYGMEAFLPEIKFDIMQNVNSHLETGNHWEVMANQEGGKETARQLFGLAQQLGLNGYLTFRLTEQYVNQRFKNSDRNARMSAVHFLMSNMGYDVRLIKYNDMLTVMMPFDQKVVYNTMSITQNNGRKYTVLFPDDYEWKRGESSSIMTCELPDVATGKTSDLRVTGLSLPVKAKSFTLTNGTLTLQGEVNENIKKMFYHYPQMPNGDFASSWIDQSLRESLVEQIKEQLAGKGQKDAINAIMALCHKAFPYKSDQDWHIFEKPYFVEENFLYEYNDCEDRSIFMTYLVWNALGLPCQMIQYPGHESVTVAVNEDVSGCFYTTEGVKYFSADPTYIGSHMGMVMTAYKTASPMIDKHYK